MCNKERTVKVKSYYSKSVMFSPFIVVGSVFWIMIYIIGLTKPTNVAFTGIIVFGIMLLITCVVIPAYILLATYVFCNVDIYSETGIKRVKGKKVIFEVGWENINEMAYLGLYGILSQTPFCIMGESKIKLTEKPQLENLSLDTKTFWTPVKLKQLIEIMEISPVEIVIDDATKRRIERYKKKLAKKENKEKNK